jgi:hypothetical protein
MDASLPLLFAQQGGIDVVNVRAMKIAPKIPRLLSAVEGRLGSWQ